MQVVCCVFALVRADTGSAPTAGLSTFSNETIVPFMPFSPLYALYTFLFWGRPHRG